jgi:hypothetical protein
MVQLLQEFVTNLNSPFTQTAIRCVSEVFYLGSNEVDCAGHNKLSPNVNVPFSQKCWRWHLLRSPFFVHLCLCALLMRQFLRQWCEADSINVGTLLQQALKPAFSSAKFLCVAIYVGKIVELNTGMVAPLVCSLAS